MIKVSLILTSDRGLDSRPEYGTTLKLVISIHPLNRPTEYGRFVNRLALVDTLRNQNFFYVYI